LKVVAVVDGAPVGLVRGVLENGSAWLHSLWVSPGLRGCGLGDQLIVAVEEWARSRAGNVRLEVVPANAPAKRSIDAMGSPTTVERGASRLLRGYELVMRKALGVGPR
jgi:ribosomal protein S18 acetylase RimI-like enzyme